MNEDSMIVDDQEPAAFLERLRCPQHGTPLKRRPRSSSSGEWNGVGCDCRYPVVDGIPRFVASESYATAFGWQWKTFAQAQLDSHTGTMITRDRLRRCLGGDLTVVEGRTVLEAGCGAGRFTEILLGAGARVFACDLSAAVEASYANFGKRSGYFLCQADILALPLKVQMFDVVLCLGVIQHTPNPERTILALAEQVRPGGMLVIDHYTHGYAATPPRRFLRTLLLTLPQRLASRLTVALCRALLPLHRRFWKRDAASAAARRRLTRFSPLVDYFDAYPQLPRTILEQWAILDTHDTLTDRYKHLRSAEEIRATLEACGLEVEHCGLGGNGVEARAIRPSARKDAPWGDLGPEKSTRKPSFQNKGMLE